MKINIKNAAQLVRKVISQDFFELGCACIPFFLGALLVMDFLFKKWWALGFLAAASLFLAVTIFMWRRTLNQGLAILQELLDEQNEMIWVHIHENQILRDIALSAAALEINLEKDSHFSGYVGSLKRDLETYAAWKKMKEGEVDVCKQN